MGMDNENKNTNEVNGEPKKKKYSVVFRPANSQQNSVTTRPAGTAPARRPAGAAPAAPGRRPAARPAASQDEAARKPAVRRPAPAKPAETEPVKPVRPEAAAPQEKPVQTAPEAEIREKAVSRPAETPVKAPEAPQPAVAAAERSAVKAEPPVRTERPAAPAAEKTPAAPARPAEPPKEPAKPAARFVDLGLVRAAEQEAKERNARLARQQAERRNQARQGAASGTGAPRTGDRRFSGQPAGSRGPQTGSRPGMPAKDDDRTARRPAAPSRTPRPAGAPASGGDMGLGLSKGGKNNKQSQRQAGAARDNNRYNKGNSDEMRRPGGKNARGKGGSIKELEKVAKAVKAEKAEPQIKVITIPDKLTIQELASAMKMQPSVIIKKLFLAGKVFTVNQEIDYDTAADIALEFDVIAEQEEKIDLIEELLKDKIEDKEEDMVPRPPVVCVMGHVDHGKTSLLDAIRKTNVTSGEAGGITQHIGAYMVEINGQKITFLDTPGHEAFTAMRMRGAQATDIAILVVAADDGVMPQTVEAINHARAAGVEIVVAINKIDKPGANIDKVKKELTEYGLVGEEWGGTDIFVPVSAKRGDGIEELLEMMLLVAEMHELKANPNRRARGLVIEAQLDPTRGPVATVLVQKGTLHVGDQVAAGGSYGRIRAMLNDKGERVTEATPGMPVEILGISTVPSAGEVFISPETEKEARSYAETFISEERRKLIEGNRSHMSLDDLFSQIQSGNMKELNLIVKADVQGSVEAVKASLTKLSNEEVAVKVIHSGAGNITETDVTLAAASNAIVIGFNVKIDAKVKAIADQEKVDVRLYDVIYQAIEDVQNAMLGILEPVYEEQVTGHAVVRQVFKASGIGSIAGSYVLDGKIVRGSKCRVKRGDDVLYEGTLASLKRFKDDVKEVAAGYECGLVFDKFNDFTVDDTVEFYTMVQVERKLK